MSVILEEVSKDLEVKEYQEGFHLFKDALLKEDIETAIHLLETHENDSALIDQPIEFKGQSYPSLLHFAVAHKNQKLLNALLRLETIKVDTINERGETPLLLAVKERDFSSIKKLICKPSVFRTFKIKDNAGKNFEVYLLEKYNKEESLLIKQYLTPELKIALDRQSIHDKMGVQGGGSYDDALDYLAWQFYVKYYKESEYSALGEKEKQEEIQEIQMSLKSIDSKMSAEVDYLLILSNAWGPYQAKCMDEPIRLSDLLMAMWLACSDLEARTTETQKEPAESLILDRKKRLLYAIWDIVHAYEGNDKSSPACRNGAFRFLAKSLLGSHSSFGFNANNEIPIDRSDLVEQLIQEGYQSYFNSLNTAKREEFEKTFMTESSEDILEELEEKVYPAINYIKNYISKADPSLMDYRKGSWDLYIIPSLDENSLPKKLEKETVNAILLTKKPEERVYKAYYYRNREWVRNDNNGYKTKDAVCEDEKSFNLKESGLVQENKSNRVMVNLLMNEVVKGVKEITQVGEILNPKYFIEYPVKEKGINKPFEINKRTLFNKVIIVRLKELQENILLYKKIDIEKFKNLVNTLASWKHNPHIVPSIFRHLIAHVEKSAERLELLNFLIKLGTTVERRNENNLTLLMLFSLQGNVEAVQWLLTEGKADINATAEDKKQILCTALKFAIATGQLEIVKCFIKTGRVDANEALHIACEEGHLDIVKGLLAQGIHPTLLCKTDKNGYTILGSAASAGHNHIIEFLLGKYQDLIHKTDDQGFTVLMAAAYAGQINTLKLLLQKDYYAKHDHWALVKRVTSDGMTVLMIAVEEDQNEAIIKFLLETDPSLLWKKDNQGRTALMIAVEKGHIDNIKLLLETDPALLWKKDNQGRTALMIVVEKGHIDAIKLFSEKDPNLVWEMDYKGRTPFILAVEKNKDAIIELFYKKIDIEKFKNLVWSLASGKPTNPLIPLIFRHLIAHVEKSAESRVLLSFMIKQGASVEWRYENNLTPLMLFSVHGNVEAVQWLLTEGKADINKEENGCTAFMFAIANSRMEIGNCFISAGKATITEGFKQACIHTGLLDRFRLDMVKGLLTLDGADIDTAFMWACRTNKLEIVKFLVTKGANLNANVDIFTCGPPLCVAATFNSFEVVKWLIKEAKVDVDTKNNTTGETALVCAIKKGHIKLAEWMIEECNASPNVRDNDDMTPLIIAFNGRQWIIVKCLAEAAKLNENFKFKDDLNNLIAAVITGDLGVVKSLAAKVSEDVKAKAMHMAAHYSQWEIVKYLIIEANVDVNHKDENDGETILFMTIFKGNLEIVQWLITEAKADVNVKNKDGDSVMKFSIESLESDYEDFVRDGLSLSLEDVNNRLNIITCLLSPQSNINETNLNQNYGVIGTISDNPKCNLKKEASELLGLILRKVPQRSSNSSSIAAISRQEEGKNNNPVLTFQAPSLSIASNNPLPVSSEATAPISPQIEAIAPKSSTIDPSKMNRGLGR